MSAGQRLVEERKVVSVLFVDLVDFTARADQADPEDVKALLRPYHARLREEIERLDGTLEKFVGDAVMAVFGAPVAHEDDAERAVRAALRIVHAVAELNEAQPELRLSVRAAVNTGETVVDLVARPERGEGIVAGDVVNTASRLQQAGPTGGVVVGEATYHATEQAFEYEALEPVDVKGKVRPVPIWQAMRARRRSAESRRTTPFIGRDAEIALLDQMYARTLQERSIQLVTVTGEPGVGKTRLVDEFASLLGERPGPVVWRQGRCLPYGEGITFWALGEIVKAHAEILESDGPAQVESKLVAVVEEAVEDVSEREWFAARLGVLVGTSVPDTSTADREESFTAWRRFLEAVALQAPLVLVIEDLHWADAALLDFIEHLVDWCTDVPMFVVCTARPELFEGRPLWAGGKRNSTTISLSPLTTEQTAKLVSALLSQAVLPAETQTVLLERAGGNPLYAEEFARMLLDRGILQQHGRTFEIAADGEIPVPETVQALIAARLDTLTPDRKSLLHDAAVIGKVFWAGAVSAMSGVDARSAREGFHELARKEFVRPARSSSVEHEDEYSFWHVLVRDVAYTQIPRAARARKHRAAAKWIEGIAKDRVTDQAELLAHHYTQALELTRASGAIGEAAELEPQTRRFLVLAGDRALQLDVAKAEAYYRAALELIPPDAEDRPRLLAKLADAAWLAGRLLEAEQLYEQAIAEFRTSGDLLAAGDAMVALVASLRDRGETAAARSLLDETVSLLEREPAGRELAQAYLHVARDDTVAGRAADALVSGERAIGLAKRLGLTDYVARSLQFRGGARCQLGDLGGLDDLRESLRISVELGLGYTAVNAYGNLAEEVWRTEGPAEALPLYRAGIDHAMRRGITFKTRWLEAETLWALYDLGHWDELLQTADSVVEWDDASGGSQVGVMALSYRARVLVRRGKVAEAASMEKRFLPAAREIGDLQVLAPALTIAALIEHARLDDSTAIALIHELEASTRDHPSWRTHELPESVRICAAAGDPLLAERLLEKPQEVMVRDRYSVLTARAVLDELRGRHDEGLRRYIEAAEGWGAYGFPLEEAQARLGSGRCLLGQARVDEACASLNAAAEIFRELGAQPLLEETEGLLAIAA